MDFLLIGLGSALGGMLRFFLGEHLPTFRNFPCGIFFVNVSGCLLIGILAAWGSATGLSTSMRRTLMTGFLGGYTTFSAFSLETFELWTQQHKALAGIYVLSTVTCCLVAVAVGYWIGRQLSPEVAR